MNLIFEILKTQYYCPNKKSADISLCEPVIELSNAETDTEYGRIKCRECDMWFHYASTSPDSTNPVATFLRAIQGPIYFDTERKDSQILRLPFLWESLYDFDE
jgi:hypothetical protein